MAAHTDQNPQYALDPSEMITQRSLNVEVLHRSPLRTLGDDKYSVGILRGRVGNVVVDLRPELERVARESGININEAEFKISNSQPSPLALLRKIPGMNAPVKLLTLSSFFKEIKHSKQEEKNPKKITLNELTDISVGAGEGLGEFKLYTITISDKNKTAILILNVGNVKTYREFIKWHEKQKIDLSWRDSLATPCPAYSLETHSLVKGSSDCKPENFRTLEQDRFAAITHPWPAGYVGIEARQNPEKGKWSGSQEIYVCAPGETVCERSTQFPTGGTVDRVSPKRGKSPRVVASISGHLIADVWPGYIARNFDGWPKWEMYPVDGNKSQQLAKFTSMYLQARPILPASGIGLAPSSLSGTGQN